ncbi:MAG: polymer-forming cytoskeletal protein [Bacteroidota bacterium]
MTKEQKRTAEEFHTASTHIGKGTTVEGNIETGGNIRIEGKVNGFVRSKAKVALGPVSAVEGNITAQNADIEGDVHGKIEVADLLTLKSTAVINGDIQTGKLVVEPGASFNGNCSMGSARNLRISDNGSREEARTA